ncbi:MAG TPA: hypothetical protein PLY86_20515 [bacterium]|nr:hypothetical protein [bacterium]
MAAVATDQAGTRLELDAIRRDESLIRRVIGWGPNVSRGRCPHPQHPDEHPSASLYQTSNGVWRCKCFSCEADGDVVEWQKIRAGQTFKEAVASLLGENPYTAQAQSRDETHRPKPARAPAGTGGRGWDSLDALTAAVAKSGKVESVYHYGLESENHLIVYRIKTESGKEFRQCKRESGRYFFGAPAKPHPLYRRDLIVNALIAIVVEGEKCADAINALALPGIVATTSPGGSQNARGADWSPLAGKIVYCWQDNDEPGQKYIADVIDCLKALPSPPSAILEIDPATLGLPEKGDVYNFLEGGGNLQDALATAKPVLEPAVIEIAPEPLPAASIGPGEIAPVAFQGLAGQFIEIVKPETESDPVALLVHFMTLAGNIVGRTVYSLIDSSLHFTNIFTMIVGATSGGRKDTAFHNVRRLFSLLDIDYTDDNIKGGVSSGEGLKWFLRDPEDPSRKNPDPGVEDKRLCLKLSEVAELLKVSERSGNTVTTVLRELWDSPRRIRSLTKNDSVVASLPHVSFAGHITCEEVRDLLTDISLANGFANRFIWVYVQQRQELPFGGSLQDSDLMPVVCRLREVMDFASRWGDKSMGLSKEVRAVYPEIYSRLIHPGTGLIGAILARGAPQIRRLAMTYAMLDLSTEVRLEHLNAALALWDYSERSVRFIWGDRTGFHIADEILAMLKRSPGGLSRTDISNSFGRNVPAPRIQNALDMLAESRMIVMEKTETGRRPAETWKIRRGPTK